MRDSNFKVVQKSGPGFALRVFSSQSGMFAWPMLTVGADWDIRKKKFFEKRSVVSIFKH
jgi:hypothetical protein